MRVLVLPGGAARGALIAEMLAALERAGFPITFWDVVVATSSGGWNAAYAVCGQLLGEGLRLWTEHLPAGFLRFAGGRLVADFRHLEMITKYREPLAAARMKDSRTTVILTTTDLGARQTMYVHLNAVPDPIRSLIVASTMPIVAKPVSVAGHLYGDGALTDPIPLRRAEAYGADEIWVFLTTPRGYRNRILPWRLVSRLASSRVERELLVSSVRTENERLEEIDDRKDLKVIRPSRPLPLGFLSRDRKRLASELVALGEELASEALRKF